MRRFKILGRDVVIGKRLFGYGRPDDDFFSFVLERFGTDRTKRQQLDAYKGIVYDCISLIGEQAGSYHPRIYRMNGDQREYINSHPLFDLLRQPAGGDPNRASTLNQFSLFEATVSLQALQGEAYWYIPRGQYTSKPKEIVLLRADRVGTDIDKTTGEINGYFIRRNQGEAIPLEVQEVLHFPLFNPFSAYHGYGMIEAGDDTIATDEATNKFTRNFFHNNAGLSGVLSIKGEVTKGAFRKFVRAWRDKYEGVDAAGKTAIVRESDATFTKIGLGLNELDMANLRKMTLEEVAMHFKVPMALLGKSDQSGLGRANVEALEYIFAKYNIEPKFKRLDSVLQIALERYYGGQQMFMDHISLVPEDKEFELNVRDKGVDRWKTRNEIRDEDQLDPIDGGDQLFVPLNNIPVDTDTGDQAASSTTTSGLKLRLRRVKKQITAKEHFRLGLMRNQRGYERRYKVRFRNILRRQHAEVLVNLEAKATSLTKDFTEHLFDPTNANKELTDGITPVLVTLAEQQGGLALVFAGDSESEFAMTASMIDFVRSGTERMANNFNNDTLEKLNGTLSEGILAGEGIDKLKKRVASVYDQATNTRALRVARTETLKASNEATNWAYKQTGYVTAKEWYVNPDACPICAEFDGKIIGLDETFAPLGSGVDYTDEQGDQQTYSVSYDDVDNPPLHPNCRCTILPVRE